MASSSCRVGAVLALTPALLVLAGCRARCGDEWERLRRSTDARMELARAEQFSDCIIDNQIDLAYSVKDPHTGAPLSDDEMAKRHGAVKVEIELDSGWRLQRSTWTARSMDSVWPLFRE